MPHQYELILSHDERKAIYWIGNRYFHGDELYDLLCACSWLGETLLDDVEAEWDGHYNIIFYIPENIAWQIRDGIEGENREMACFSDNLKAKFFKLIDEIV